MNEMNRRRFVAYAVALGASFAACLVRPRATNVASLERRDLFPEGVASGDPEPDSVLLWTRRPYADGRRDGILLAEVAEDRAFSRVVATARARVSASSDWTCRVLVGGLAPSRVYWYRFTDPEGFGSRVGRTLTAPAPDDPRSVRFSFVSCQNVNQGAQNAYRRMIFEDERAAEEDRIDFVLHLGDFIYEIVWYPEDRPQGMYDRRLRDVVRYDRGEKSPTSTCLRRSTTTAPCTERICTTPTCRTRGHAGPSSRCGTTTSSRAGWQGLQVFQEETRPAQTRKVAANQAWSSTNRLA